MSDTYVGNDLAGARQWMDETAKRAEGTHCPCCCEFVKVYHRAFTADMARFMIWLVKLHTITQDWVDVRKCPLRGGDYAKTAHWELAELKENENDPSKKTSGLWKPTQRGIDFVYKRIRIASHVDIYLKKVLGFDSSQILISDALGNKFDYEELMSQ